MVALLIALSGVAGSATSANLPWAAPPGTHTCSANNVSRFGPMGCAGNDDATGHKCCKLNQQSYECRDNKGCNVCPWCCHDSLKDPHACSACVAKNCNENLAKLGCSPGVGSHSCCPSAPQNASASLKNVLLIGDSVTNGMSGVVAGMLKTVAQTQKYASY
jgi:hypothetical protein